MSTMWLHKKPGQLAINEEECAVVIGPPDWVRLPHELGGGQVAVSGVDTAPCPMCAHGAVVRHLELDGGLGVAECTIHGFVWYKRPC